MRKLITTVKNKRLSGSVLSYKKVLCVLKNGLQKCKYLAVFFTKLCRFSTQIALPPVISCLGMFKLGVSLYIIDLKSINKISSDSS